MINGIRSHFNQLAFPLLFLLLLPVMLTAQESFRGKLYNSYIKGNMDEWVEVIAATPEPLNNTEALYEYTMAVYGIIGYYIQIEDMGHAKEFLKKGQALNEILLDRNPEDSRFLALGGAITGFEMNIFKHKIPVLGPRSVKIISKALEMDPNNPHALFEEGNKTRFMPAMLGGSKEKAINNYLIAIAAMEKDPNFTEDNWFYPYALITLADLYMEMGLSNRARGIYLKLLRIEPEFKLAKTKLETLKS